MRGKRSVSFSIILLTVAFVCAPWLVDYGSAYRVCTFKGTVIDHGWRSMTVKSNGQCAEVNVGWRTKYLPNRRPCLGERVAVDFILEDGYMKATKVVSLSPLPPSVQCFPPAPPGGTVCRTVGSDTSPAGPDACTPARPVCSTRPPAHVADPNWSPSPGERPTAKPGKKPTPPKTAAKEAPSKPEPPKPPVAEPRGQSVSGEVVASSPQSLSVRVQEGDTTEVVAFRVRLKTRFKPFRRPATGEKVQITYSQENGDKFAETVNIVQ